MILINNSKIKKKEMLKKKMKSNEEENVTGTGEFCLARLSLVEKNQFCISLSTTLLIHIQENQ